MNRPIIHLFAEQDHDTKNKDATELALLAKIRSKNRVLGLSFEINRKCQRLLDGLAAHKKAADFSVFGDKVLLMKWAIKNKVPLLASDNWAEDAMLKEVKLEDEIDRLEERKNLMVPSTDQYQTVDRQQERLVKKLRRAEKENLSNRDSYTTRRLSLFLRKKCRRKRGVLVHVCGLGHVPSLIRRFRELGHETEVTVILEDARHLRLSRSNIHTVKGSLLDANVEMIAHGVAQHRRDQMAKGIAKEIKTRCPGSFLRFASYRDSHPFNAGDVWIDRSNWLMIAYIATQPDLRRAQLRYIDMGMRNLRKYIQKEGISSIGIPKIGCGYGKLQWDDVRPLIDRHLKGLDALIVIYERDGN